MAENSLLRQNSYFQGLQDIMSESDESPDSNSIKSVDLDDIKEDFKKKAKAR